MFVVFETGGKQYKVSEGDIIFVEKLGVEEGEKVTFDRVLAVSRGENTAFGAPYIDGAKIEANVVKNGRAKKIVVLKYKAKKNEKKKQGHRQPYTMVKIESLTGAAPKKEEAPKAAAAEEKAEVKEAKKVSASMKKDELIAFAKENNIAIDEKATKAVIIEAIEEALK